MDLTFQVPMQYCSLQHRTLLLSPVTSTSGYCFCFASILRSFWSYFSTDLQWHIGHLPTWGVPLSVSYHFAFSYCSWGFQGKNTEVVCHSLLQCIIIQSIAIIDFICLCTFVQIFFQNLFKYLENM